MKNEIESYLIFNNYTISKMMFDRNYNFDEDQNINLSFKFNATSQFFDNNNSAYLKITCKIFEEEFEQHKAPFYLEASIDGEFTCKGNHDIESFEMNGMAILLPYLRSIITSFTSQAGIPPVILPPINVYNAFEKIDSNQEEI